jgi:tRNA(Ile)-lysidine synthase
MSPTPGAHPAGATRGELVAAVTAELADLPEGARAVVALSGGPDSTALAYLVAEARPDLGLTLAHVRHGLRDDTEDLAVVAMHADWLGLPLETREVEVVRDGDGLEAAARDARYAALREVAAEAGAEVVLVGHTADDQAETVLLRLARGTGLDGLTAMRPCSGDLLRPMLRLRRADVHRFVMLEGLPSVRDPHNLAPEVRRVVVRERLLPALEAVAPDPVGALTRLARLAADDVAAIEPLVEELLADTRRVGDVVCVPRARLAGAPVAVARRAVRALVTGLDPGPPPSAATTERLLSLAAGGGLDLPGGLRATAGGGWLAFAPIEPARQERCELTPGASLSWAPAAIGLRWHGPDDDASPASGGEGAVGQISLELPGAWSPPAVRVPDHVVPPGGDPEEATLLLPEGVERVVVRHRRQGDRLRLTGGTRRLKDLYIDAGVPRPLRARWPVVTDLDDRVLWVPGVATDDRLRQQARHRPGGLLVLTPDPARGPAGGPGEGPAGGPGEGPGVGPAGAPGEGPAEEPDDVQAEVPDEGTAPPGVL